MRLVLLPLRGVSANSRSRLGQQNQEFAMFQRLRTQHRLARAVARIFTWAVSPLIALSMRLDAWADDLGWRVGDTR